jgi:hypothetical protein
MNKCERNNKAIVKEGEMQNKRRDKIKAEIPALCAFGLRSDFCARDRNRTDTPLPAADFESAASTSSATRAFLGLQYYEILINSGLKSSNFRI